ncbi:MAG: hypothetical protein WBB18_18160, partial [Nodosilinea sp.]
MQSQKITLGGNTLISAKQIEFAEECFSIFYLLFFAGVFGFGNDLTQTSVIPEFFVTLLRYATYAISIFLVTFRLSETVKTALSNKIALGLVLMIFISFLWSPTVPETIDAVWKEAIPMFLFSLYLASRFTLKQQFKLTVWFFLISFFFSAFLALAMPSIGLHNTEPFIGSWKGAFSQKNEFGALSAMTMIALYMLANYSERKRWWPLLLLFACSGALLVSSSVTAIVLSVVGLFLT